MEKISIERLVDLAERRELPQTFEHGWILWTKMANPVTAAFKHRQRETEQASLRSIGILLFTIAGSLVCSQYFAVNHFEFSTVVFAAALVAVGAMFLVPGTPSVVQSDEEEIAEKFCRDLEKFLARMNVLSPNLYRFEDPVEARKIATEVLSAKAEEVMKLEEWEKSQAVEAQVSSANRRALQLVDFRDTYEILEMFGFASGGWAKYFRKAEQKMKNEKAPESPAALRARLLDLHPET